jgi:hypothetical protein
MSELTLTIIRLGLLILLWVFVFSVVGVLRGDLYGTRITSRIPRHRSERAPAAPPRPREPVESRRSRRRNSRIPRSLTVTEGALSGTSLPLRESGTLIGRNPECALVLDDDFASGRHARIFEREGTWYVEDLGSTNGTFLGSERLSAPVAVQVGTVLRIGKTVLELKS